MYRRIISGGFVFIHYCSSKLGNAPKTKKPKLSLWFLCTCTRVHRSAAEVYSRRDLNPHGHCWPLDFKSNVSTNSTTRATALLRTRLWRMWTYKKTLPDSVSRAKNGIRMPIKLCLSVPRQTLCVWSTARDEVALIAVW